jgi:hypothetical protein
MAYPAYVREKARTLRVERQLSIDEIAERLALPKTTVFYWVRDLPLGRPRRANPGQRRGNRGMRRKYRELREAAYAQGRAEFEELASIPTFTDFVCLYIAEGYKRQRNNVELCNSDPGVIALAVRWMRRFARNPVRVRVQYHADQDADELRRFWGGVVGVTPEEVGLQRKSNSSELRKRVWRSPHGVLAVRTCDTLLRARLQAWMDCLQETWLHSADSGAWRSLVSRSLWVAEILGSNPGAPIEQEGSALSAVREAPAPRPAPPAAPRASGSRSPRSRSRRPPA